MNPTWVPKENFSIKANTPTVVDFNADVNAVIVRNPNGSNIVYMDFRSALTATDYEAAADFDGTGVISRPYPFRRIYLFATADLVVNVYGFLSDNPAVMLTSQLFKKGGVASTVSVTSTVGLKASELSVDAQKHLQVDVLSVPSVTVGTALPAGGNNIGNVGVASMPTVVTGADGTTGGAIPSIALQIGGSDGSNFRTFKVDNTGLQQVNDTLGVKSATTITEYNVTMTSANTEYSQALPAGTKKVTFGVQTGDAIFRYAYTANKVATPTAPYQQVPAGAFQGEDELNLSSKTLYFASPVAGKVMQIICYS